MSRHNDDVGPVGIAVMLVAALVIIAFIVHHNSGVDDGVRKCLDRGGVPIVSVDRGVKIYSGCALTGP